MSWLLAALGAAFLGKEYIKEMRRPTIPASYWRNEALMREDDLNPDISPQQVMKNLENGKYYLSDAEYERRQKEKKDMTYALKRDDETYTQYYERVAKERERRSRL